MPTIVHPFLNDGVEARAYQIRSLRSALTSSSLMVMPTGFGKTAVEWMAMAEFLLKNEGKILLIAPTTGLVEQQERMAKEMIKLDNNEISRYTGEIAPKNRPAIWRSSKIIMATSQVIRNDAQSGTIDLSEVSLLIVDEAHHATGNHAYAQVGDLYLNAKPDAIVLAATASPGSNERNILEVASRLGIERLDVSRREEPLLKPYGVELHNEPIRIELPDELLTLIFPLQHHQNEEVERLQRMGFLAPTKHLTSRIIEDAQRSASAAIQRRDARGYDAARRISDLRRMHLLIDLLKTQGLKSALSYLSRAEEDGRSGERGTNRFVSLKPIHDFRIGARDLSELHPKTSKVKEMSIAQLNHNPESKILIFTEYRDTVENLLDVLGSIENLNVDKFIGQSSRGKRKGMNQRQQLEQLRKFREGEINVLVATSVGEEGLDVPSADLVILYEPVPSAIRAIQRRGRTARQSDGTVKTLITKNTRDEFVHSAAKIREERMYTLLDTIQKRGRLPRRPAATNDVLVNFKVKTDSGNSIDSHEFLETEIDRLLTNIPIVNDSSIKQKEDFTDDNDEQIILKPSDIRPRNQTGLDSFFDKSQTIGEKTEDAISHREKEEKLSGAAQKVIEELVEEIDKTIILDHRESSSTLAAYLRSMGFEIEFQHLDCGDIKISEQVIIERKTSRDLLNSLVDGRLMKQCHKLVHICSNPLLLIELGEVGSSVHPNAVLGAMAHITLDIGIPVMMTKNTLESAHFISIATKREDLTEIIEKTYTEPFDEKEIDSKVEAARNEINSLINDDSHQSPLIEKWKLDFERLNIDLISSLIGVEQDIASILLDGFGTIVKIFTASRSELIKIEGIDNTIIEKIIQQSEQD
tara:strand:+ start:15389 stop:17989 length:2601 start_codon:yes stop_codon:yes gene_type:complete